MIPIILVLVMTHMTILCVTIYLHRHQAHRALTLHPAVAHGMRFWLWLTTGMITKQWVAVHRKHHQRCEQQGDPHSPHVFGILRVLFGGAMLYSNAVKNQTMVLEHGRGTPTDWVEQNIYSRFHYLGVVILLVIEVTVWQWTGLAMWLVQMLWIPFWAAGVINGLGHWWGYRNVSTKDHSTNIMPWGIVIGGEELHNNHHADSSSARLSRKWWEFDVGWMWIRILSVLGLAQIKRG